MPSLDLLDTLVFSWLLINPGGNIIHQKVSGLFPLPDAAISIKNISHYVTAPPGWSRCPLGFSVYCVKLDSGKLVFPGLRIFSHTTAHGKMPERSVWLTQQEFQDYVANALINIGRIENTTNDVVSANIHDIRRISTDIYSAIVKLMGRLDQGTEESEIAKNIDALTDVLRNRVMLIDYLSNPTLIEAPRTPVKVYNKFYKMWKSMKPSAGTRNIKLELGGQSDSFTDGILSLFDLIPYLMLDNAIKYSPANGLIQIVVRDEGDSIITRVSNLGPAVSKEEQAKVFLPGFRGKNAIADGKSGSGIGLATLLKIVKDIHGGILTFTQDDKTLLSPVNNVPYARTDVEAVFKKSPI